MICGPGLCGGCGCSGGLRLTARDVAYILETADDHVPPSPGLIEAVREYNERVVSTPRPEQPAPLDRPAWVTQIGECFDEINDKLDALLASRPQWEEEDDSSQSADVDRVEVRRKGDDVVITWDCYGSDGHGGGVRFPLLVLKTAFHHLEKLK